MDDGTKEETMRAAVPVDKGKGRQVFEDVTRQRIDPALLEVTQGDNFKLRVYPLDPGQTRRVRLTYSERLGGDADAHRTAHRLFMRIAWQHSAFRSGWRA
jgi:hypothetical protein